ncbi:MAG: hypothetical protein R8G66_01920 [Cytophagales bacterium]|nr:hypothetical protein [Cytophagales bacterium]
MKSLFATLFVFVSLTPAELPELNKKVIEYVNKNMRQKVGRGECWDLAAGALAYSNAYFDRSSKKTVTIYGRELNPKNDEILPGDMIQFKNVRMKWREGNTYHQSSMIKHTAIVYEVNGPGDYEIAHQNTGAWGKKVGVSNLKLSRMTSGRIWVYRPVASKADM